MGKRLLIFFLGWIVCACAFSVETKNFAERAEVQNFIDTMVNKHHFKKSDLITLFTQVTIRPTVLQHIRRPLERRPWHTYQNLFITEARIRKGVEFWHKHSNALKKIESRYGVPASIIVATIGIETTYGLKTGDYRVIDALTNIGFSDSPRANFFKSELEEFLLLTREKNLDPLKVLGSYAGAIGQPQFMPSSYRRYAVSYSGRSDIDLSNNELDVIASIANYYKQKGWKTDKPIALPASLVNHQFEILLGNKKNVKIISTSTHADYEIADKITVQHNRPYKILELQNFGGNEYWFSFHNFDVIKRYNPSDLYAMAVFQLSHYIFTMKEKLDPT